MVTCARIWSSVSRVDFNTGDLEGVVRRPQEPFAFRQMRRFMVYLNIKQKPRTRDRRRDTQGSAVGHGDAIVVTESSRPIVLYHTGPRSRGTIVVTEAYVSGRMSSIT